MFTCICGKQFKTKQSLNGHKGYCKKYLGEDKYLQIIKNNKNAQIKSKQTLINKNDLKQKQKLQQWIFEKHKCEKCGKIMIEKYASGRFCSKECARGFSNYKGKDNEKKLKQLKYNFKCPVCNNKYKSKSALTQHIKLSHNNYYVNNINIKCGNYELNITKTQLQEYRNNHFKCEICGKDVNDIKKENNHFNELCIDHNHVTHEFRGLLCMTCNRSLGWFEKNELAILNYLNSKGRENK